MNKLPAQFRKLIRVFIVKRRRYRFRSGTLGTPVRSLRDKIAVIVNISMLPDYSSSAQITNQKLKQVCICRIFRNLLFLEIPPYTATRNTVGSVLINNSYNFEMKLGIGLEPIDKQSNHIIARESRGGSIGKYVSDICSLVFAFSAGPFSKCLLEKRLILFTF